MIQHAWTIMCRSSVIDRDENTVSLLEIVEQLAVGPSQSPRVPVVAFDVVTLWYREAEQDPEGGLARLEVVSPDGESQTVGEYPVNLEEHRRLRYRTRMVGFFVRPNTAGRYWLQVSRRYTESDEWDIVSRTPLQVEVPGPPEDSDEDTQDS